MIRIGAAAVGMLLVSALIGFGLQTGSPEKPSAPSQGHIGSNDGSLVLAELPLAVSAGMAEAGELILRAVDMDTGKAIPGVTFAIENGSAEVWAVEVGKADADGVLRLKAQKRPGYYYMVWQKPKDYKVAGFDDAYINIVPGGKVGYDFKLRKMPSAKSFPSFVPLPPGHHGRIPPPRRLENNIHWASTVEDMPGFGRKRVTFWFYPDKQGRVPTKRLQLAERIFHNGPRIAAAVRDELKYFQKAVPEDRGDIENMQEILIELGGSNSAGEVNNNWRFWCRLPGGMPLLQHGYRIGFTDLESWDLEVPFYLQPAPAGH